VAIISVFKWYLNLSLVGATGPKSNQTDVRRDSKRLFKNRNRLDVRNTCLVVELLIGGILHVKIVLPALSEAISTFKKYLSMSNYRCRVFSTAGPTIWNLLPDELIDPAQSFDSFRQFLKIILFGLY